LELTGLFLQAGCIGRKRPIWLLHCCHHRLRKRGRDKASCRQGADIYVCLMLKSESRHSPFGNNHSRKERFKIKAKTTAEVKCKLGYAI